MSEFNSIFPTFIGRCGELKQLLTPIAYLLLVGGLISTTLAGQRSGSAYMRSFGRTIILIIVLNFLVSWGNEITSVTDATVKNVLKVDPTKIYDTYQDALEMRKSSDNNKSWWEKIFEFKATIFEAFISAFLWLLGLIASVIVFFAYILQKIILFIGYALAPIFIGFLAVRSLYDIGKTYFLHLLGVMLWPLGWGVAGLITQGLIEFMTDRSFLHTFSPNVVQTLDGYSFQNFIGVGALGVWIIFSTIAAPVILAKSLSGGFLAASNLLNGAASVGRAALATGVTTGASAAAGGTGRAIAGGLAVGVAAGAESLISTSAGMGSGSIIGSVASMRSASNGGRKNSNRKVENPSFPADDLTGGKTVGEVLRKTRNPYSQKQSKPR